MSDNVSKGKDRSVSRIAKEIYSKYGILIILVIMLVGSTLLTPVFLTQRNLINVMRQMSVIFIIACGTTMVIISGMIDLSSGSVAALSGVVATGMMVATKSAPLAVAVGIIVGGLCGAVNGAFITTFKLPPFIMTLAMMISARGLVLLYTGGIPISGIGNLNVLGQGFILGVPIPIIIMMIIFGITWVLLNRMKFGRYIYAIGGNEEAAIASGVSVKRVKAMTWIINGMFVGLAGVILMARINSGQPAAGQMYELDAITTVVLGGTSLSGGIGTIQGTLAGAMIIGILNNVLNLLNVSPYYQQILKGAIIVTAVILDIKTKEIRAKS